MMYIIGKIIYRSVIIVVLYLTTNLAILPNYTEKLNNDFCDNVHYYYSDEVGVDVAALISKHQEAVTARLDLIANAKESIDIAQFYFNSDKYGTLILGEILRAAERGVKVRIVIDGKYRHFTGFDNEVLTLLNAHPNITFKLFEPFNLFKPWTVNNLLHDKIMIIDKYRAVVSGRNIANRYLSTEAYNYVFDIDHIITFTGEISRFAESAVKQLMDYFETMWNSPYTKDPRKVKVKEDHFQKILNNYKDYRYMHPEYFTTKINIMALSVPTNKITLIANPLNRVKKPKIWCEIASLINNAKEEVYINSPYVVPTEDIKGQLKNLNQLDITVITNSAGSTPNYFAFSGYLRYKKELLKYDNIKLYEYQGGGSLHSKSYIIDNRISIVGSYNLDPRSTYLSTEIMLVIDSEPYAQKLKEVHVNYISQSLQAKSLYEYHAGDIPMLEIKKGKKFTLEIMRHVAYLFDHLL